MKPRHIGKHVAGIFLLLSLALGGCVCPGFFAPTQHHVEGLLTEMPAGSTGAHAFALLKNNGFEPKYDSPRQISGQRTADFVLMMEDWWIIVVELDGGGKVVSTKLAMDQNYS